MIVLDIPKIKRELYSIIASYSQKQATTTNIEALDYEVRRYLAEHDLDIQYRLLVDCEKSSMTFFPKRPIDVLAMHAIMTTNHAFTDRPTTYIKQL